MSSFDQLGLIPPLLQAVGDLGYRTPTPVQEQAIPLVLAGRDLMAGAQTGTGKTAAFALPILQRLGSSLSHDATKPRCLILCPTRELATQIGDGFRSYGRHLDLRHTVIFGGVSQHHQVQAQRRGVDIIIATPGRLLDLMQQRQVDLRAIEVLVLDEADRMLDMGFIQPIRKIVAQLPKQRQTLLFSATMPEEIRELTKALMRNPVSVQVSPVTQTADKIEQSVYHVERVHKPDLLAHLYHNLPMGRAIVFTRTKHGADRVVRQLHARGIRSEAIHGNKSQNARQRALDNFRKNRTPILVATDIASRGIDIDDITHVVNYDLTHEPETYVHRIGRTARAGASGSAVSFCDREERANLKAIERLIRRAIPVRTDHPTFAARAESQPQQRERRDRVEHHPARREPRAAHVAVRREHPLRGGRSHPTHSSGTSRHRSHHSAQRRRQRRF